MKPITLEQKPQTHMKKSPNNKIIPYRIDWRVEMVLDTTRLTDSGEGEWESRQSERGVSMRGVRVARRDSAWEGVTEALWRWQCDGGVKGRVTKSGEGRHERESEWQRVSQDCARVRGVNITFIFWKNPIRNRVSETRFPGGTHRSVISTWMDTSHKNWDSKTRYINRVL